MIASRCEQCGSELSQCGELDNDGIPTFACEPCALREALAVLRAENMEFKAALNMTDHDNSELRKKLKAADAWQASVNEALNSGDGSYRPMPDLSTQLAPHLELCRESGKWPVDESLSHFRDFHLAELYAAGMWVEPVRNGRWRLMFIEDNYIQSMSFDFYDEAIVAGVKRAREEKARKG